MPLQPSAYDDFAEVARLREITLVPRAGDRNRHVPARIRTPETVVRALLATVEILSRGAGSAWPTRRPCGCLRSALALCGVARCPLERVVGHLLPAGLDTGEVRTLRKLVGFSGRLGVAVLLRVRADHRGRH